MPTVLKVGSYRFFFYSSDFNEPAHVHVERDSCVAKIWIDPIRLQSSGGFSRSEINKTLSIIAEKKIQILEGWNEYFNS